MEDDVLNDIQAIEQLQDEDLLMAGVDYSATRRYAELLLAALAAWNKKQRICLVTEEIEAVNRWRARSEQGQPKVHETVLSKYNYLVWGSRGCGLIAETGDALGEYPISFWNRPETEEFVAPICLEATAMAAYIHAHGPSDENWGYVARMGGADAALEGELDEIFSRISRKAREAVEREAQNLLSAQLASKLTETPSREPAVREALAKGKAKGYEEGRKDGIVEVYNRDRRKIEEGQGFKETPQGKKKREKAELLAATFEEYKKASETATPISMTEAVRIAAKKLGRKGINVRSLTNQAYKEYPEWNKERNRKHEAQT